MAAGILPAPGSQYGPCESQCKHRDCAATRRDAVSPCRFCGQSIEYGKRFIRARLSGALAHERCAEMAVERNDARLGEF
jgi:hypothetical protein